MEFAIPINEAARRSGVGRSSIYEAVNRGELKLKKSGRRSLILVEDLKAWVTALPDAKQQNSQTAKRKKNAQR